MCTKCKNYGPNCIGQVVRILDDRTLIVNAGSDQLSVGDKVFIYVPVEPIIDLDGSELAMYERIKDKLKVIESTQHYSVCQKPRRQL